MYRIETLYLNPNYAAELGEKNLDLVCYVVEIATNKTIDVAVVKRNSLASWYEQRRAKFPEAKHTYLVAAISLFGEIKGVGLTDDMNEQELAEFDEKYRQKRSYRGKKIGDPNVH